MYSPSYVAELVDWRATWVGTVDIEKISPHKSDYWVEFLISGKLPLTSLIIEEPSPLRNNSWQSAVEVVKTV